MVTVMSEANNTWRLTVDGHEHEVTTEYTTLLGRIEVRVDGATVVRERILFSRTALEFTIGARPAQVVVDYSYGGLLTRAALFLDGGRVEPLPR